MSTTYNGGLGTTVTVSPVDSTSVVGFSSSIALVGESDGGTATIGDPVQLSSEDQAVSAFGSGSPIVMNYALADHNGAGAIYGVGVDASAPDYKSAVMEVADDVRYIVVLTESDQYIMDAVNGAEEVATDMTFTRVFAPGENTDAQNTDSYSPRMNGHRYVEVAPATATLDGTTGYTASAVAAQASRQPLGSSITYDELTVDSLGVHYRRSDAKQFSHTVAVTRDGVIAEGVTTSDEDAFKDIFQVEILDVVTLGLDEIGQRYAGDTPNTPDGRNSLKTDCDKFLQPLVSRRPPLLSVSADGPAFDVSVELVDNETVKLKVAVSPMDVMKLVEIEISVGSLVTLSGINA